MSHLRLWIALLLLLAAGCSAAPPVPTLSAPVELTTPTPPPTRRPSATPRRIASPTPVPTRTVSPTVTDTPPATPTPPAALDGSTTPSPTIAPPLLTQAAADPDALPANVTVIGESVQGRAIIAQQFGTGDTALLLVGGIHGGYEINTVQLMNEAIAHFAETPEDIAPGLTIVIVPMLNPDGVVAGRLESGRFNANGVDLNRNWGCDWAAVAYWRDQTVDPGPRPFSEPETAALADYILLNQPAAVIFYHSAANGVFPGACESDHGSQVLGHVYGTASGYPSGEPFTYYEVTGDASSWVDGQGIPAITVELETVNDAEWDRNYQAIMAVQCELARGLSAPSAQTWAAGNCVGE